MTPITSHITAFLRERLPIQRGASPNTCCAYADTFRLLFEYAGQRCHVSPSKLHVEQLDAYLIMDFLEHLETVRGNSASTRNARLTAIKSFVRFVEYRVPALLEQCYRIRAIPSKRSDSRLIRHLTIDEVKSILNVPDLKTASGVRDRAMMHLCYAAGLRVSELVSLPTAGVVLDSQPWVRITGKGRKERCLPLWKETANDLRRWLNLRGDKPGIPQLFLNARGIPMTRYGFQYLLGKHVRVARRTCPSLQGKHVSPHTLRHSCAMTILQATGDIRKVSLWLGHADLQTTQVYLRADPTEKLAALDATLPPVLRRGAFRPPDELIASLKGNKYVK